MGNEPDFDDYDDPESPYCECDLQYGEEEQASNKCGCCGKPID